MNRLGAVNISVSILVKLFAVFFLFAFVVEADPDARQKLARAKSPEAYENYVKEVFGKKLPTRQSAVKKVHKKRRNYRKAILVTIEHYFKMEPKFIDAYNLLVLVDAAAPESDFLAKNGHLFIGLVPLAKTKKHYKRLYLQAYRYSDTSYLGELNERIKLSADYTTTLQVVSILESGDEMLRWSMERGLTWSKNGEQMIALFDSLTPGEHRIEREMIAKFGRKLLSFPKSEKLFSKFTKGKVERAIQLMRTVPSVENYWTGFGDMEARVFVETIDHFLQLPDLKFDDVVFLKKHIPEEIGKDSQLRLKVIAKGAQLADSIDEFNKMTPKNEAMRAAFFNSAYSRFLELSPSVEAINRTLEFQGMTPEVYVALANASLQWAFERKSWEICESTLKSLQSQPHVQRGILYRHIDQIMALPWESYEPLYEVVVEPKAEAAAVKQRLEESSQEMVSRRILLTMTVEQYLEFDYAICDRNPRAFRAGLQHFFSQDLSNETVIELGKFVGDQWGKEILLHALRRRRQSPTESLDFIHLWLDKFPSQRRIVAEMLVEHSVLILGEAQSNVVEELLFHSGVHFHRGQRTAILDSLSGDIRQKLSCSNLLSRWWYRM